MEKYPDLDIRVMEMKTPDIRKALLTGEADAAIIASMLDDAALTEETLFYEQFLGYVSKKEPLFKHDVIRTSDVTGERLWLLDEGHCFRDQLVRFCQMEAVKISQMAYRLGSMETFMHMVESGKGITFIPELERTGPSVCYPAAYPSDCPGDPERLHPHQSAAGFERGDSGGGSQGDAYPAGRSVSGII